MNEVLLWLAVLTPCAFTLHSDVDGTTVPLRTNPGIEVHAAVTDMPKIIDLSHANPKTWHTLPPAAPTEVWLGSERRFVGANAGGEAAMRHVSVMMVRCPTTGHELSTGVEMDETTFEQLSSIITGRRAKRGSGTQFLPRQRSPGC